MLQNYKKKLKTPTYSKDFFIISKKKYIFANDMLLVSVI